MQDADIKGEVMRRAQCFMIRQCTNGRCKGLFQNSKRSYMYICNRMYMDQFNNDKHQIKNLTVKDNFECMRKEKFNGSLFLTI